MTKRKISAKFIYKIIPPRYYVIWRAHRTVRKSATRGEEELKLLDHIVPRRNAVDIGANRGTYTYFLAKRCPKVYAYEPNPWMADFLRKASPAHVDVREAALSDTAGRTTFTIPYDQRNRHQHNVGSIDNLEDREGEKIDVETRRIDDEGLEDVGFIKIDVEGHEPAVLDGARQTIERDRPVLLVEILETGLKPEENPVICRLFDLNYDCLYYDSDGLHHISQLKIGHKGRNFLFLPKA